MAVALKRSDFEYYLPKELIAQEPLPERDKSRLMVVYRDREEFEHRLFRDLPEYLVPGDVLVLNRTRVLPARLYGAKEGTGGKVEVLLLRQLEPDLWEVLVRPGRRVPEGTRIVFGGGLLRGEVLSRLGSGGRLIRFTCEGDFFSLLHRLGEIPLPPYIKRKLAEPERYQTVYASEPGSAAAPTAGLHFTPELLQKLQEKGVEVVTLTLHIGLDTFRPVKEEDITAHRMHSEEYHLPEATAEAVNRAKREGRRIVAVGTTVVRCLESVADERGLVRAGRGFTDLFIYPGYRFKVIDALVTNFHLPGSTLLMLVAAFAGREKILRAYAEAVRLRYRFFSFGDAMLIL
ncbi:tRNA preQ1(34) S-adenosylmethionine ribosyltransferase-isomerase QueA [Ammonifex thiophilus]|uniref:tRNA preQ1(34) S-adenosylmethionine ribosyltransferase-isomerase QueA n=1 Tax=Ammonifex thiophilus TaxID=444093 RepID=UPI001068E253|nr:tRNA preQ1(34) S-adenosylmethionine ribosyltransferase-isomerase QueA [Ammonifex thiophilus]